MTAWEGACAGARYPRSLRQFNLSRSALNSESAPQSERRDSSDDEAHVTASEHSE